jgi:hypothetical protein
MGPNTTVQQSLERLNELNRYLLFFPEECPRPLTHSRWNHWDSWSAQNSKLAWGNDFSQHRYFRNEKKSLLSSEINLTNTISWPSIKLGKHSHPTTKLVVTLNVNHEEHVLSALADTGASSSIILKAYTSKDFNRQNKDNKISWHTMGGHFYSWKDWISKLSTSRIQPQEANYLEFHVDDRAKPLDTPKIGNMIRSMEGFTFATALDLNMCYYHITLDTDTQKLCTIIFHWGEYKYKHLPTGIKIALDTF